MADGVSWVEPVGKMGIVPRRIVIDCSVGFDGLNGSVRKALDVTVDMVLVREDGVHIPMEFNAGRLGVANSSRVKAALDELVGAIAEASAEEIGRRGEAEGQTGRPVPRSIVEI